MPVLGVCLGLQCIGQLYGGDVVRAPHVMHGKTSEIRARRCRRVRRPAEPVHRDPLPLARRRRAIRFRAVLEVTAESEDGLVMGLRHREFPIEGVQFHPESILTDAGHDLLRNFLAVSARADGERLRRGSGADASASPSSRSDASASPSSSSGRRRRPSRRRASTAPRRSRNDPAYGGLAVPRLLGERAARRAACSADRATVAVGVARGAHHRAEIHEREQSIASAHRRRELLIARGFGFARWRGVRRARVARRGGC